MIVTLQENVEAVIRQENATLSEEIDRLRELKQNALVECVEWEGVE